MKTINSLRNRNHLFIGLMIATSVVSSSCAKSEQQKTPQKISSKIHGSSTGSTDNVLCDYKNSSFNSSKSVNKTSTVEWSCTDNSRQIKANGIPDHATGTFPNEGNPHTITELDISENYTLNPQKTNKITTLGGPRGTIGYILNGIKIDAGTGGTCDDSGSDCSMGGSPRGQWRIEALSQSHFNFGTDDNNAHVQPGGQYHYHGIPEGFVNKQGGDSSKMTIIGWAADGFPIYARYGYSIATDASSSIKKIKGSFKHVSTVSTSRPSTDIYPLGTFMQDWEYVKDSGDLDECNGRFGVTPEFPQGIYHYFATDNYPYFQRCVKGTAKVKKRRGPPPGGRGPGGPRPDGDGLRSNRPPPPEQ